MSVFDFNKLKFSIIFSKNIQYNLLSVINIFISFFYIIFLGRKFGAGTDTDIYFFSISVVGYMGIIVQCVWSSMSPYYVKNKIENVFLADKLYSVLLNNVILLSSVLVIVYFIVSGIFDFFSLNKRNFLDIFIYYLIFQSIILLNKYLLNLEEYFSAFYLADIFISSVNFVVVYFSEKDINYIAFSTIFASIIVIVFQFYLIFGRLNYKYRLLFFEKNMPYIYRSSIKLNISLLFFGFKDFILMAVFMSFGTGVYSLYIYANKFAVALLQITNAPTVNVYVSKLNYIVVNKDFNKINGLIKDVLAKTIVLFIMGFIILYYTLPIILSFFLKNKISSFQVHEIQNIFCYIAFFYLIIVIESPYSRSMSILKLFNYNLIVNLICFLLACSIYYIFCVLSLGYDYVLVLFSCVQFISLSLHFIKSSFFIKNKISSS